MLQSIARMFRPSSQPGRTAKRPQFRRNFESLERRELFSVSTPEGNWVAAGGGIQDTSTGLVWGDTLGHALPYGVASSIASNLVAGGYDDWRLPTKDELIEAVAHDGKNYFDEWYGSNWTTTQGKWKTTHWVVKPNDGSSFTTNDASALSAVPVRGTRVAPPSQPNVRVFTENMTLTEGEFARFSVVLDKKPTANVTIAVTSTDPTEGTSSVSSFVFTRNNWNVPQRANVNTPDDGIVDGDVALQIVLANAVSTDPNYNGRDVADIDVTVLDNVVAELVSEGSGNVRFDAARFGKGDSSAVVGQALLTLDEQSATTSTARSLAADHVFGAVLGSQETPAPKRSRWHTSTR